jgi:hypothetical protein
MDIRDGGLDPCKPVPDDFVATVLKESIPESLLTRGYAGMTPFPQKYMFLNLPKKNRRRPKNLRGSMTFAQ